MADAKGQVNFPIILLMFFLPAASAAALVYDTFVASSELTQWIGIGGAILSLGLLSNISDKPEKLGSIVRVIIGINSIILGLVIVALIVWVVLFTKSPGRVSLLIPVIIGLAGVGFIGIGGMIIFKSKI